MTSKILPNYITEEYYSTTYKDKTNKNYVNLSNSIIIKTPSITEHISWSHYIYNKIYNYFVY